MKFKLKLLAILIAAAPLTAFAATELPPVEVTSTKTATVPAGAQKLTPEQIKAARAATSDSARLLTDFPGVSLFSAGGGSALPIIHGLADDRLRTQVDGMDLIAACPNHMNSPLSYIDPTNIGRVRVYSGVVPVSVGGDSIGGTIEVDSPDPVFAKPGEGTVTQGEIGGFYRSNGSAYGGNLAATLATRNFSLSYRGSTAQNVMPLNAKLGLVQNIGAWQNTVETVLVAAKTDVSSVRGEQETGGFDLVNLRTSYTWNNTHRCGHRQPVQPLLRTAPSWCLSRPGQYDVDQRRSLRCAGSRPRSLDLHQPELQFLRPNPAPIGGRQNKSPAQCVGFFY
ncbi:MAG: hypothetical protein B7X35_06435 [Halothiobacillus sp. 14-56-357]|jgi:outer membrane receptor protein involved in Fe transport|uniref:TonB-dependent receptor plug domain-containing protein n=1 Tax=Halothiobacillus sp. 15-55-196 TaxID=1970382 RepID=UPI000BCC63EA|nr:TonB-dependent receptor [Halothiobacillus sp. 15-55-196]OZB36577.1 MAG: hypothetical protein B7X44_05275 [Halothiobacillus sp. 15-55-196]OZB56248.1 MAG: hypothetical protein B7X35_06435 [Halothiobacillus sp. 14-56-357]OZB79009.1 MAG: hypothetical protein B7X29_02555 [Halothiobacillus sp. 13-55-115]